MYARLAMIVPFRPTRLTAIRRSRPISAERVSRYDEHMTMTTIAGSVLHAIGRTPLVRLRRVVPAGSADVLVKLEYYNPTGSYKDRMALAMIEGAEARGTLKPGMRVVEFTGGSTGSSLAMVCAVKGYQFTPVSSDAFSKEKLDTMRAFGAELIV